MRHRLTLAATAVAAASLLAACGSDDNGTAADPDATSTAAVTTDRLLTDAETEYSDGADWFRSTAFEGDGQDAFHPCARESLAGTGATSVVRAEFDLRNSAGDAPETTGDFATQVVGQYADEAAATAAYDQVAAWVSTCTPRPAGIEKYRPMDPRPVEVEGGTAQILEAIYGPVPEATADEAYIMETGLVRVGDRLSVLTTVIVGQDYNFLEEDGGTPVNRMLPKVAARLQ